jgi:putative inorganic carbon (hco3(-)) transporter
MKGRSNISISYDTKLIIALSLAAVAIPFLLIRVSIVISPILIILIFGVSILAAVVYDYKVGIYAVFISTSFIFLIERLSPVALPFGTIPDLLIVLTFFAFLITLKSGVINPKAFFSHPITIGLIVLNVYHLLQAFNPNAVSLKPFLFSLRTFTLPLLFVLLYAFFQTRKRMERFVMMWLIIATAAAIYGLHQEFVGLLGFEWDVINRLTESQKMLIIVWGHLRKFSFLSDPPAFGVFMGISALACFMIGVGPVSKKIRIMAIVAGLLMLWSMGYSGTRTAYALAVSGFVLFGLLAIKRKSTMYLMCAAIIGFVVIMFGPFHNGAIVRFRSAFKPSEDASMEVRDVKRIRLQPYVRSHPIGGGLFTTGAAGQRFSPGHELSGLWDPDSGYLQNGLEQGWIGLLLEMSFYFVVMFMGIDNFYRFKDPTNVMLNLVFLVPFFSMTIAPFTQNSMPYKPSFIIALATYAALIKLKEYENLK